MKMEQIAVDKKDRHLLYLLDVNGRAPYAELARKTGMSKQRVKYRVERLERIGLIKGYYTLVDTSALGYMTFRVYLKLRTLAPARRKELLTFLKSIPEIWALYTLAGRYDLALGMSVKAFNDFHAVWERILQRCLIEIKDYAIAIYNPIYHYPKSYLVEKPEHTTPRVLGANILATHDTLDLQLLDTLTKDARTPLTTIALDLAITPEAVSARLKQLERKGIVQGYRAMIDIHKLGYEYYKVDVRLKSYERMKDIQAYCAEHPNIYQFDKTIGGETLEIEFNVRSLQELLTIMDELEMKFPGVMESFEYLTIVEELKTTYLPIHES